MKPIQQIALNDPLKLVAPACLLVGALVAGDVAQQVLIRWGKRTSGKADVVVAKSVRGPIRIWSLILGISCATEYLDLPERSTRLIDRTLLVLTILSLTLMASRM